MGEQEFTYDTVTGLSGKLRYNLETYMDAYNIFVTTNLPAIQDYYTKVNAIVDTDSFDILALLLSESRKIDNLIKINKNKFQTIDEWEFVTFLEDIKMKLTTTDNLDRWLRSSKDKNSWRRSNVITSNYVLGQNETLERVNGYVQGDDNAQNDWVQLSLENQLMEKDYDTNGGTVIQISRLQSSLPNFSLKSVVDNLVGIKMYGRDFSQKFKFVNNDISALSYQDTVRQTVTILAQLKKYDIPEFTDIGVDQSLAVGGNTSIFFYGSIERQLAEIFAMDDTLINFSIKKFAYANGDLFIDFDVDTFFNSISQTQQPISKSLQLKQS